MTNPIGAVVAIAAVLGIALWFWLDARLAGRRLRERMRRQWGQVPADDLGPRDFDAIVAYSRRVARWAPEAPRLDDTTWRDLDLDDVFLRLNATVSTPGEEVLYDLLRTPAVSEAEWQFRHRLVSTFERDADARLDCQLPLSRLGKSRHVDVSRTLSDEPPTSRSRRPLYRALSAIAVLTTAGGVLVGGWFWLAASASFLCNIGVYYLTIRDVGHEFLPLSFLVRSVRCAYAMPVGKVAVLAWFGELLEVHRAAFEPIRSRTAFHSLVGRSAGMADVVAEYVRIVLLWELVDYEVLRHEIWEHREALRALYRSLGTIDAAIAMASHRLTLPVWSLPELHEAKLPEDVALVVEEMAHPLVAHAVANSLAGSRTVLVTGSNASGKSTYLKGIAVTAILAQAACTATARRYRGAFMHVVTSMGERDALAEGRSTYIVELESLRRVIAAVNGPRPVLVCLDEILRGTNTVDRIAVASEVLREVSRVPCVCLAATHDLELTYLLAAEFRNVHFREEVTADGVTFDYRLREGRATERNALSLAERMGFAPEAMARARELVATFERTGAWQAEGL